MQAEITAVTRSTSTIADLVGLAAERYGDGIAAGAVALPIYPTRSPEESEYLDEG